MIKKPLGWALIISAVIGVVSLFFATSFPPLANALADIHCAENEELTRDEYKTVSQGKRINRVEYYCTNSTGSSSKIAGWRMILSMCGLSTISLAVFTGLFVAINRVPSEIDD